MATVLVRPGPRLGKEYQNSGEFRAALENGDRVVMTTRGVFFDVTLKDNGDLLYTALEKKPDDVPAA